MLNTTSGMILVQFTIEPLSFQHPGDDIFARPELVSYNGAIVDSQSNILYTYGVCNNVFDIFFKSNFILGKITFCQFKCWRN